MYQTLLMHLKFLPVLICVSPFSLQGLLDGCVGAHVPGMQG